MATADQQTNASGAYVRARSAFRDVIETGSRFEPEAGRYHLHVSLACPWACGTLSMLYLKGLEKIVSHSIVHPTWQHTRPDSEDDQHRGWVYRSPSDEPLASPAGYGSFPCDDALKPDEVTECASIRQVYELAGAAPGTTYSTPVLWDRKEKTIVNNESTEILQMFNSAFDDLGTTEVDLYPAEHEQALQDLNDLVYNNINNGVYRAGFARSQSAYDTAVSEVFAALDRVEEHLSTQRYLTGSQFTWLDLRLFHTLVRFDPVYHTYFKTNEKHIADYPNLLGYMRDIYGIEPVGKTINMEHIKTHYFSSHPQLNSFAIVPKHNGPDLTQPSGRGRM